MSDKSGEKINIAKLKNRAIYIGVATTTLAIAVFGEFFNSSTAKVHADTNNDNGTTSKSKTQTVSQSVDTQENLHISTSNEDSSATKSLENSNTTTNQSESVGQIVTMSSTGHSQENNEVDNKTNTQPNSNQAVKTYEGNPLTENSSSSNYDDSTNKIQNDVADDRISSTASDTQGAAADASTLRSDQSQDQGNDTNTNKSVNTNNNNKEKASLIEKTSNENSSEKLNEISKDNQNSGDIQKDNVIDHKDTSVDDSNKNDASTAKNKMQSDVTKKLITQQQKNIQNSVEVTMVDKNTGESLGSTFNLKPGERLPSIVKGGIVYLPVGYIYGSGDDSNGRTVTSSGYILLELINGYGIENDILRPKLTSSDIDILKQRAGSADSVSMSYIAVNTVPVTSDNFLPYTPRGSNNYKPVCGNGAVVANNPSVGVDITHAQSVYRDATTNQLQSSNMEFGYTDKNTAVTPDTDTDYNSPADWYDANFLPSNNANWYYTGNNDPFPYPNYPRVTRLLVGINSYNDNKKIVTFTTQTISNPNDTTINSLVKSQPYETNNNGLLIDKNGNILRFRVENATGKVYTDQSTNGNYVIQDLGNNSYKPSEAEFNEGKIESRYYTHPDWVTDVTYDSTSQKYGIKVDSDLLQQELRAGKIHSDDVFTISYFARGALNHDVNFKLYSPIDFNYAINGVNIGEIGQNGSGKTYVSIGSNIFDGINSLNGQDKMSDNQKSSVDGLNIRDVHLSGNISIKGDTEALPADGTKIVPSSNGQERLLNSVVGLGTNSITFNYASQSEQSASQNWTIDTSTNVSTGSTIGVDGDTAAFDATTNGAAGANTLSDAQVQEGLSDLGLDVWSHVVDNDKLEQKGLKHLTYDATTKKLTATFDKDHAQPNYNIEIKFAGNQTYTVNLTLQGKVEQHVYVNGSDKGQLDSDTEKLGQDFTVLTGAGATTEAESKNIHVEGLYFANISNGNNQITGGSTVKFIWGTQILNYNFTDVQGQYTGSIDTGYSDFIDGQIVIDPYDRDSYKYDNWTEGVVDGNDDKNINFSSVQYSSNQTNGMTVTELNNVLNSMKNDGRGTVLYDSNATEQSEYVDVKPAGVKTIAVNKDGLIVVQYDLNNAATQLANGSEFLIKLDDGHELNVKLNFDVRVSRQIKVDDTQTVVKNELVPLGSKTYVQDHSDFEAGLSDAVKPKIAGTDFEKVISGANENLAEASSVGANWGQNDIIYVYKTSDIPDQSSNPNAPNNPVIPTNPDNPDTPNNPTPDQPAEPEPETKPNAENSSTPEVPSPKPNPGNPATPQKQQLENPTGTSNQNVATPQGSQTAGQVQLSNTPTQPTTGTPGLNQVAEQVVGNNSTNPTSKAQPEVGKQLPQTGDNKQQGTALSMIGGTLAALSVLFGKGKLKKKDDD
ncbi:hypothetical protein ACNAN0_11200 [Agrilactobacillus fermenti]|uniref:hypothetical protein n=1 Tax=Agrilactobacillus fermenti TaxID=2586909 RepID=UPI003A5C04D2